MNDTDALDDQLSHLHELSSQVSQQLALLSILAIARLARSALPGAAYVSVGWSDQGPYLVPDGGYLTADGTQITDGASFSEDTLDAAISAYCVDLGEDNQGTWQAFTIDTSRTPGELYHLKIDDIVAAIPAPAQPAP
jgi:hypothetical protein